jgi:hypothetical protein
MANRQLPVKFRAGFTAPAERICGLSGSSPSRKIFTVAVIVASQQEITPQLPITWALNCAIWTPGNEAQKRQTGPKGRRVTNSHVIRYDVDRRYARCALDGADL